MPDDDPHAIFRQINDAIVRSSGASTPPESRRRRVPRQSISWFGRYRVGESAEWDQCEVVDVSVAGVGAILAGSSAAELVGAEITVQVHAAAGAAVRLELRGEVRHAVPTADRRIRVGVEFVGLSDTERTILDALERMGIGW